MSQQNVLKRSHKADFAGVNRERSFVKQSAALKEGSAHKRRSQTFVKPAMEIYRPPNVRSDLSPPSSGKLNVHAKEFTMSQQQQRDDQYQRHLLQMSKSSGNVRQMVHQQQAQVGSPYDLQGSPLMHHHHQQQQQQQHHGQQHPLQHSKSSGSILKTPGWQFIPVPTGLHVGASGANSSTAGLIHSSSTSQLLQHLQQLHPYPIAAATAAAIAAHRVDFHLPNEMAAVIQQQQQQLYANQQQYAGLQYSQANSPGAATGFRQQPLGMNSHYACGSGGGGSGLLNGSAGGGGGNPLLKRSKSFTAAVDTPLFTNNRLTKTNLAHISEQHHHHHHHDPPISSHNLTTTTTSSAMEDMIATYPLDEHRHHLRLACDDPHQVQSRILMDLVRVIMERLVAEGMTYAETAAKLCATIARKETARTTFIESLVNACQQWYQERDKILRSMKAGDGTRFTTFMWFLTELCGQLKCRDHKQQTAEASLLQSSQDLQPHLVLLSILAKCCEACVNLPIRCLAETECLFFVLTSIGRELEQELPAQLEQLMGSVRDGFLASAGSPAVCKTLLQLIELHASDWQLTGSAVLYYYPRTK